MARILVLYYSSYGHIATMADAVAEGVRNAGHECDIRRVAETAPPEVAKAAGFRADESHPLIEGADALGGYDGIVIGAPTRFGRMPSALRSPRRPRSTAGRRRRCFPSSPTCCISAARLWASTMAFPGRTAWTRSRAARPTARRRSPTTMARANRARLNSTAAGTWASAWRRRRPS